MLVIHLSHTTNFIFHTFLNVPSQDDIAYGKPQIFAYKGKSTKSSDIGGLSSTNRVPRRAEVCKVKLQIL